MIATLEEASHAVQLDLECLATAQPRDLPALTKLSHAVRTFAAQADSLFAMLMERNAPDPLVDQAEELVDVFQIACARLGVMLPPVQV